MIRGIGLDIIELDRVRRNIRQSNRFVRRILTEKEREVFDSLQNEHRKVEYAAGRFAAKEAFAKALGVGIGKLSFQHIEVLTDEKGAPTVQARGYEDDRIFISITHSREYAAAQVVIEYPI
ncbi:holo-ACP synthase [Virgibacillus kimchii]